MDFEQMYKEELKKNELISSQLKDLKDSIASGDIVKKAIDEGKAYSVKRFTGLSEALNKKSDELKRIAEEKKSAMSELKTAKDMLAEISEELEATKEKNSLFEQKLSANTRHLERFGLIVSEFPSLASLEGQGLLPQAENIDELRDKLSKLSETISDQVKESVASRLQGVKPQTPAHTNVNTGDAVTVDSLRQEALKAKRNGEYAKYRMLRNKAVELELKE